MDLDKLNLAKICNGGLVFRLEPISSSALLPQKMMLASKFTIGLKHNRLALLIETHGTRCIAKTPFIDTTELGKKVC